MAAKHFEPTFKSEIERACYRFIFEEECVKEYYDLLNDGTKFGEVMWEVGENKRSIDVHVEDGDITIYKFSLKKFPQLVDFLDNLSRQ